METSGRELASPSQITAQLYDIPQRALLEYSRGNPDLTRLFEQDADCNIRPGTLKGRFTLSMVEELKSTLLPRACWEMAWFLGSPLSEKLRTEIMERTGGRGKPFDLTMVVAMIADDKGTVHEATIGNLLRIHKDRFDLGDEETRNIYGELERRPTIEPPTNALILEIRKSQYDPKKLGAASQQIVDESQRLVQARLTEIPLNFALQSAIARSMGESAMQCSTAITDTRLTIRSKDTKDRVEPVVIYSMPSKKNRFRTGKDRANAFTGGVTYPPTTLYLVRDMGGKVT